MNDKKFSVIMVQTLEDNGLLFCHPTDNAKLYISKNGETMVLDPQEIKDIVKSAGGNFRR